VYSDYDPENKPKGHNHLHHMIVHAIMGVAIVVLLIILVVASVPYVQSYQYQRQVVKTITFTGNIVSEQDTSYFIFIPIHSGQSTIFLPIHESRTTVGITYNNQTVTTDIPCSPAPYPIGHVVNVTVSILRDNENSVSIGLGC